MHKKKEKRTWLILLILVIIIGYFWYQNNRYQYFISTPVEAESTVNVSFIIKNGDKVDTIAENLKSKNLILDEGAFKTYLKKDGYDRKIIAGRFLLTRGLIIPEIVGKITDNKEAQAVLTVPEGSTINDIDKKLVDLDLIKPGEFSNASKNFVNNPEVYKKYTFLDQNKISKLDQPLEGFLFPDTYFINGGSYSNENLISMMLNNFARKALPELTKTSDKDLYDKLIMASIIEKEVRTNHDRSLVAGILWKRLGKNWQLGADATLLYLKSERTITSQDLAEDSPYNTRKKLGLPPGPISNPGTNSIIAVSYPENSPYFFYLTKPGSGETVYAVTNEEHNQNRARYLQ